MAATDVARARELVAGADRLVVLTGAGVSAESGVPTFRGAQGMWKQFRPEELATPTAFARDPRLVWEWYGWRRELVGRCRPNAAHRAIARHALSGATMVVTQNVDGLHADAARLEAGGQTDATPAMPLELHGSLFRARCTRCGHEEEHRDAVRAETTESLPTCTSCAGLLRPAVVWFGEMLDADVLAAAHETTAAADVCLVVGTSAVVQPAAGLALVTRQHGGAIVEINPEPTPLTGAAVVSLRGSAATLVPELLSGVQ